MSRSPINRPDLGDFMFHANRTSAKLPRRPDWEAGRYGEAGTVRLYRTGHGYTLQIRSLGGTGTRLAHPGLPRFVLANADLSLEQLVELRAACCELIDEAVRRGAKLPEPAGVTAGELGQPCPECDRPHEHAPGCPELGPACTCNGYDSAHAKSCPRYGHDVPAADGASS